MKSIQSYLKYLYIFPRYNQLLGVIKNSLEDLKKAILGLVVMSGDLEEAFNCIYETRVPPLWENAFSSLKPLAAWTRDLVLRIEQVTYLYFAKMYKDFLISLPNGLNLRVRLTFSGCPVLRSLPVS